MPQNTTYSTLVHITRRLCRLHTIPSSKIISRFLVTLLYAVFGILAKLVVNSNAHSNLVYSRITSKKSPSFCIITFNASVTHLRPLVPQSRDCSCYVSRPILAPPPLGLREQTDLRAHDFAHSADFWRQNTLANITCAWSWRLCGITPSVPAE